MSLLLLFQPVAGGTDGTANLTGVSSALSAGTITATGAATASITGGTSSASAGTIAATGQATASVTGATSSLSAGTIGSTGDAFAVISGTGSTASVGSIVAIGDANVDLSGVTTTAEAGDIVATGGDSGEATQYGIAWLFDRQRKPKKNGEAKLVGASARASCGQIIATGDARAGVVGLIANGFAGRIEARGIQNPTDEQLLAAMELLN